MIGTSPLTQKESRLSGVIRWKYPHAPLGLGHASHVHLYHLRSLSYADGLSGLAFGSYKAGGKQNIRWIAHSMQCLSRVPCILHSLMGMREGEGEAGCAMNGRLLSS